MSSSRITEEVMRKHLLWQRYVGRVQREALRLQIRLSGCVELDDLLQVGGVELLNVLDRYEHSQEKAFSVYLGQRMRGAMLDELRNNDWVPRSVRRGIRKIAEAVQQVEQQQSRKASVREIARKLNVSLLAYQQMLLDTCSCQLSSWDEYRAKHGDKVEPETEGGERVNPLLLLLAEDTRKQIMAAIEKLPEREKLVLTLYYQEELKLKEIGKLLKMGESRVCQLHRQAIKKLQIWYASNVSLSY